MMDESQEKNVLESACGVDDERLWGLLDSYRPRLKRMVELRLHPKLKGRVDASDVIQDSLVEISRRLKEYLDSPEVPFYVWVRFLSVQKLAQLHRRHLGAAARDARREVRLQAGPNPSASSMLLASCFADSGTSPSGAAIRGEEVDRR